MDAVILETIRQKVTDALFDCTVMSNHVIVHHEHLTLARCMISLAPDMFTRLPDDTDAILQFLHTVFDSECHTVDDQLIYRVSLMKHEKKLVITITF